MLDRLREWYVDYGFLILGILLINLAVVNWYLITQRQVKEEARVTSPTATQSGGQAVELVVAPTPTPIPVFLPSPSPMPTPTAMQVGGQATPKVKPTKEEFIRLADFQAAGTSWTRSTEGKWIDISLYGEVTGATWQGWVEAVGGANKIWVRLYDATNVRYVDGSEVTVGDKGKVSFYSGAISLWRGQNQYFIELKSDTGNLVKLTEAKIKLTVR